MVAVARHLLWEACMEGTDTDHDRWMDKITNALRSFRQASQRKAEELQAHCGARDATTAIHWKGSPS